MKFQYFFEKIIFFSKFFKKLRKKLYFFKKISLVKFLLLLLLLKMIQNDKIFIISLKFQYFFEKMIFFQKLFKILEK